MTNARVNPAQQFRCARFQGLTQMNFNVGRVLMKRETVDVKVEAHGVRVRIGHGVDAYMSRLWPRAAFTTASRLADKLNAALDDPNEADTKRLLRRKK